MKHAHALVIGNWKLNPGNTLEAKTLFAELKKKIPKTTTAKVVVAPPFLFIPELAKGAASVIKLGAQDVHYEERGAVTGEIGAGQLASFGVEYVIVGHSERRALGETDAEVNKKVQALLKRKLVPVVCIGERLRDSQGQFFNHIAAQIKALCEGLTPVQLQKVVIAYEPIWAIGTGKTASSDQAQEMHGFIRAELAHVYGKETADQISILYGGRVKAKNAVELFSQPDVDGGLVGGASLIADEFVAIINALK